MTATILQTDCITMMDLISQMDSSLSELALEALSRAGRNSEPLYIGMVDDVAICFYGLIPPTLMSNSAYLWLYTTPKFKENSFTFIRHSQIVVKKMLEKYETIRGHGRFSDDRSLAWLRFLGAEFMPAQGEVVPFEIRRAA